jgi:hypothetical protein
MFQAMTVRRPRAGSILAAFFAVGASSGIGVGLARVHKGQSPIPVVPPLAGLCGLMLLPGVGGLEVPRDPLMPAAMWPAIVASALALATLGLPNVRDRLPEWIAIRGARRRERARDIAAGSGRVPSGSDDPCRRRGRRNGSWEVTR